MVESNFFGKGNTTTYDRAIYHEVPWAPQDDYHNYTVHMTPTYIEWIFDGVLYRNLTVDDPKTIDGRNFPQTPMKIFLGSWAPGDTSKEGNGTVEWAQGATDFKQGPFTMYVAHVSVTDGTTGASYTYGDMSGDWQSIKVQQ
jgi:beta-glucanase (GH16 family)